MPLVVLSVWSRAELPSVLADGGVEVGGSVLVCVGGAGLMEQTVARRLGELLDRHVLPALHGRDVTVIDGGTDSGIMRSLGAARERARASFPLIGVAARGTIAADDGGTGPSDGERLEPHHTHAVLVPGERWGDESPWISAVATAVSSGGPSMTMLVNGGDVALDDAERSLDEGRPLLVLNGSGRAADDISRGTSEDSRIQRIRDHELTFIVPISDGAAVADALSRLLARG